MANLSVDFILILLVALLTMQSTTNCNHDKLNNNSNFENQTKITTKTRREEDSVVQEEINQSIVGRNDLALESLLDNLINEQAMANEQDNSLVDPLSLRPREEEAYRDSSEQTTLLSQIQTTETTTTIDPLNAIVAQIETTTIAGQFTTTTEPSSLIDQTILETAIAVNSSEEEREAIAPHNKEEIATVAANEEEEREIANNNNNNGNNNKKGPLECIKDSYCLNGGTCIISESGQMICICLPEFYGTRCQTRNICKTAIVGTQTGEQICERIGRTCLKNDKFFRCECQDDEYFIFKSPADTSNILLLQQQQQQQQQQATNINEQQKQKLYTFSYDNLAAPTTTTNSIDQQQQQQHQNNGDQTSGELKLNYIAECRKVDKCLGIRCRQFSEICLNGKCECNENFGYIQDPKDNLCKLLDPCKMPTLDGKPICGDQQAKCVATYDRELYKCICPIGYKAVKVNSHRSSTHCVALTDLICQVPMLNNCQHLCKIEHQTNNFKCSCLPGYKQGQTIGIDNHMCFFDEQLDDDMLSSNSATAATAATSSQSPNADDYITDYSGAIDYSLIDPYDFRNLMPLKNRGRSSGSESELNNVDKKSSYDLEYIYRAYVLTDQNDSINQTGTIIEQDKNKNESEGEGASNATIAYAPVRGANGHQQRVYRPLDELQAELAEQDDEREFQDDYRTGRPQSQDGSGRPPLNAVRPRDLIIKRELANPSAASGSAHSAHTGRAFAAAAAGTNAAFTGDGYYFIGSENNDGQSSSSSSSGDLNLFSAQDRCNMFCEENKICALELGSTNSYRCVCDRQGYVSIGDRCLDWCSAAKFSHNVQYLLEKVCLTGICRMTAGDLRHQFGARRASNGYGDGIKSRESVDEVEKRNNELFQLERQSSWRPSFECNCGSSEVLQKDPRTRLCKLNFNSIIQPCLPGNEGYQDCVINKHSYCTVLHKNVHVFLRDLLAEHLQEVPPTSSSAAAAAAAAATSGGSGKKSDLPLYKLQQQQQQQSNTAADSGTKSPTTAKKLQNLLKAKADKLYTCVCSPEKKFLVDKPRNRARCIDECDLLNVECGRFNRMCRAATIEGDNFGRAPLVRMDHDGAIRMNQFKRTGCECLPGFNVGPSESLDFTLDDNYGTGSSGSSSSSSPSPSVAAAAAAAAAAVAAASLSNYDNTLLDPFAIIQAASSPDWPESYAGQELAEHLRTRYMNINSRCLLDYDVLEFHATFKAPANFEPAWIHPVASTGGEKPLVVNKVVVGKDRGNATPNGREKQEIVIDNEQYNSRSNFKTREQQDDDGGGEEQENLFCKTSEECTLQMPEFMRADINEFHKSVVLVAQCHSSLAPLSFEMYRECTRYRYWIIQKLRLHFADWRRVVTNSLKETFDLMEGNIRVRVNKCQASIKRIETTRISTNNLSEQNIGSGGEQQLQQNNNVEPILSRQTSASASTTANKNTQQNNLEPTTVQPNSSTTTTTTTTIIKEFDPYDQFALIDADINCELTIHSASDDSSRRHARKVLLEKQLPKFIFDKPVEKLFQINNNEQQVKNTNSYYLMAPNTLIQRDSFDQLASHRKLFSPCVSDYAYCDKQTRCEMVDTVNFSCTCDYGYTPIGSRDIYFGDSRKEVCEDIDECLFDVCKENGLENKSICVNEIGDYRCQCIRHHVGDNKRYCNHICNVISCKYGDCRIPDEHHAFCECYEGYREADCSVQDPSVALRKANMIICGSIFTSVLLLAITLAISLNSQLKKTKKKLKRLEAAQEAAQLFELSSQQAPFRPRMSKVSSGS